MSRVLCHHVFSMYYTTTSFHLGEDEVGSSSQFMPQMAQMAKAIWSRSFRVAPASRVGQQVGSINGVVRHRPGK